MPLPYKQVVVICQFSISVLKSILFCSRASQRGWIYLYCSCEHWLVFINVHGYSKLRRGLKIVDTRGLDIS